MHLDLSRAGLRCGTRQLPGHLLPLMLAALLQARLEGLATPARPCSRADLRGRIAGWPELHRTQLWRALGRLEDAGLPELVRYRARSSGPFWLDEQVLGACQVRVEGQPVDATNLARLLSSQATGLAAGIGLEFGARRSAEGNDTRTGKAMPVGGHGEGTPAPTDITTEPMHARPTLDSPATSQATYAQPGRGQVPSSVVDGAASGASVGAAPGASAASFTGPDGPPGFVSGRLPVGGPPPLGYVAALAEADFLLDRGELYPARNALLAAQRHLDPDDAPASAALSVRRARIARRLSDWAGLRDELRELGAIVNHARMPDPVRQHWRTRMQVLRAWHLYGSLGYAGAALTALDHIEPNRVEADPATCSEYFNLRGIVLRELALENGDAQRAGASIACLGQAIHSAALAGMPDQLQIGAANLANTLSQLLEAGLLPDRDHTTIRDAPVRWLLLSESLCARRDIARNSLLNIVFLLRLASAQAIPFDEVAAIGRELGLPFEAHGFADLAQRTWLSCVRIHSQIPADQRAAFLFMWADHAAREHDYVGALELCTNVLHQSRKLRDEQAQQRYAQAVGELRAKVAESLAPTTTKRA